MSSASGVPSIADVVLAVVAVISAVIAVFARYDTKRQADESKRVADATVRSVELQKEQLELGKRELKGRDRDSFKEQVRAYHQKLREFVWVPWIQCTAQYPSGNRGTAELNVTPCFEVLDYPNRTYYDHAMEHLQAYDLQFSRAVIMDRINQHNQQVKDFNETEIIPPGGILLANTAARTQARDKLVGEQFVIWKEAQEYAKKLQEVVNNLEDGQLKGECEFERNLRKELGL